MFNLMREGQYFDENGNASRKHTVVYLTNPTVVTDNDASNSYDVRNFFLKPTRTADDNTSIAEVYDNSETPVQENVCLIPP